MTKLYSDRDLLNAHAQKRRILGVFFAVFAVYFCALAGLTTYYIMLPYADPNGTWVIAVTGVITAIFLAFAFPYLGISYKRCKAYCKMLRYISLGLKEGAVAPFEEVDDWTTRDGVDVNVADFSVPNVKRDGTMTRQVYVDGEKDFPPFEAGMTVRMVTQGNLLLEYEILEDHSEDKGDNE